jgi:hypothetical protein
VSQHRDLFIAMGPARCDLVKARALLSADQSGLERRTEVSRVALPRRRAAGWTDDAMGLRACFSAVGCSSTVRSWAGTGRPRRGTSRQRSEDGRGVAHLWHIGCSRCEDGTTVRAGCAHELTGCDLFVSEISRHSNGEPACAIRCTGRTPPGRVVQHFGGWSLLFEGLGALPSARIKRLPPKKTDTVSREGRTRRRCCFFGS